MPSSAPRPAWWLSATPLLTPRLLLRAISPADAAEVGHALWTHRDHLAPWISLPATRPSPIAVRRRMRQLADAFTSGHRLHYTVRLHASHAFLGCIALTPAASSLSYWLVATHTRRGYAREAVTALAHLAFTHAGADRVRIECLAANVRSAAVARALGFELTGLRDGVQHWTLTRDRLRPPTTDHQHPITQEHNHVR